MGLFDLAYSYRRYPAKIQRDVLLDFEITGLRLEYSRPVETALGSDVRMKYIVRLLLSHDAGEASMSVEQVALLPNPRLSATPDGGSLHDGSSKALYMDGFTTRVTSTWGGHLKSGPGPAYVVEMTCKPAEHMMVGWRL